MAGQPRRDDPLAAELSRTPSRPGLDRWILVDAADREAVVAHEPRLATSDFPMLRNAAIEGLGIALLPEFFCAEALAAGELERVLPEWLGRQGILHLVFTSRRGMLPGVRAFIDFAAVRARSRFARVECRRPLSGGVRLFGEAS